MARDRSPERDKARQIWLDSGGTMTAREVAEQVGAKPEPVSYTHLIISQFVGDIAADMKKIKEENDHEKTC